MDSMLFVSSYVVVFTALGLRFESPFLRWPCFGIAFLGACSARYIIRNQNRRSTQRVKLRTVDDRGPEVGGYLATYLLPLIVVSTPTVLDVVAYGLVMITTGVVYVRSRMVQVNPTLYLTGYRLYHVTTEGPNGEIAFDEYLLTDKEPVAFEIYTVARRDHLLFDIGVDVGN